MQPNSPYPPDPNQLPQPEQPQIYAPQPPAAPQSASQAYPPGQTPTAAHPPQYEFIMNPDQPGAGRKFNALPQNSSMLKRILLVAGGLVLLIILLSVGRSLLSSKPDVTQFVNVAQEQQEIIHLATTAVQEKSLTTTNKNFAITTQLGLTTGQNQIIAYLKKNGQKLDSKQLSLKVSAATDEKLTTASTVNNYNPVFEEVMADQLATYQKELKQAYTGSGPDGRTILNNQFKASELLLQQLNTK